MHLKCPRCEHKFDGQPDETDHLKCPSCGARLKVRARPKSAEQKNRENREMTLNPGTKLGGFEIRKLVGRGGMAGVYRGIQLSLNRPVAIKVLAARFSGNPVFVQRFELEAGALANLNHPNIVNIIDKGVHEEQYYFVMELVEGITLDQLLHAVELNERHYTHIINEISKALTYVHSKGIIHRDIKPSNVLVNKTGMVKVSDFGIAHITDAALPPERFGKNATVGTANYMAPEQATDPANVSERADIYALAVTFYKMFTKQLPLDKTKGASLLNAKLPRSVDSILMRSMDPNPNSRYQTVQEFCNALLECFAPASKPQLVGASNDSGPFMFNPTLGSQTGSAGSDVDSSAASGLFYGGSFPALGDSALGTGTPFGTPAAKAEADADVEDEEGEEDTSSAKRRRIILHVIIAFVAVALLAIAGFTWYIMSSGY